MITKELIKKCIVKLPWWMRFLLWFKKPLISCDVARGGDAPTYYLVTKELFGGIFIIKEYNSEEQ